MRETDPQFGRELDRHITGYYETKNPRSPYYDGPEDEDDVVDAALDEAEYDADQKLSDPDWDREKGCWQ